jgi:hypothetical protein
MLGHLSCHNDAGVQIQVVELRGAGVIPSYFTFRLNLTLNGVTTTTDPISAVAVPGLLEEVVDSPYHGQGTLRSLRR